MDLRIEEIRMFTEKSLFRRINSFQLFNKHIRFSIFASTLLFTFSVAASEVVVPEYISKTYDNFLGAISDANLEKFKELYALTDGLEYPSQNELIEFRDKHSHLLFPALNSLNVVAFKENENCAGIIYREDDEYYVNLTMIKFKKVKDSWRVYSSMTGDAFELQKTEEDTETKIREAIEKHEELRNEC